MEEALNDLYAKVPNKTLLWTNSSPTSAFAGQQITLSDSLDNYSHILLQWYKNTSNTTSYYEDIYKLQPYRDGNNSNVYYSIDARNPDNGAVLSRFCWYIDTTHLGFSSGYHLAGNWHSDYYMIPYKIYGINISY